jgi:hypothetical protein
VVGVGYINAFNIVRSIGWYTFLMNAEELKRQFLEYIEIERGRAV